MVVSFLVFLLFIFAAPVFEHYGEPIEKEKGTKVKSDCQVPLAPFCQGLQGAVQGSIGIHQDQTAEASLKGFSVVTQNISSNVEAIERPVALPQLQQAQQIQYKLLRRLRWSLGGLHGSHFCPSESTPTAETCTAVY